MKETIERARGWLNDRDKKSRNPTNDYHKIVLAYSILIGVCIFTIQYFSNSP